MDNLKPCPFCGGTDIDSYQIGNEWTKKRAFEIKCKTFGCCTTRTVGVIGQYSIEWAKNKCIERWNTRADVKEVSDDQISLVASDESNHHDWNDLRFKNEWQEGFVAGAKWMKGQVI